MATAIICVARSLAVQERPFEFSGRVGTTEWNVALASNASGSSGALLGTDQDDSNHPFEFFARFTSLHRIDIILDQRP